MLLSGGTIEGMDITVGTGKTLDVDGAVDIDASPGNMDGVTIGANTTRLVLLLQQKQQA